MRGPPPSALRPAHKDLLPVAAQLERRLSYIPAVAIIFAIGRNSPVQKSRCKRICYLYLVCCILQPEFLALSGGYADDQKQIKVILTVSKSRNDSAPLEDAMQAVDAAKGQLDNTLVVVEKLGKIWNVLKFVDSIGESLKDVSSQAAQTHWLLSSTNRFIPPLALL